MLCSLRETMTTRIRFLGRWCCTDDDDDVSRRSSNHLCQEEKQRKKTNSAKKKKSSSWRKWSSSRASSSIADMKKCDVSEHLLRVSTCLFSAIYIATQRRVSLTRFICRMFARVECAMLFDYKDYVCVCLMFLLLSISLSFSHERVLRFRRRSRKSSLSL